MGDDDGQRRKRNARIDNKLGSVLLFVLSLKRHLETLRNFQKFSGKLDGVRPSRNRTPCFALSRMLCHDHDGLARGPGCKAGVLLISLKAWASCVFSTEADICPLPHQIHFPAYGREHLITVCPSALAWGWGPFVWCHLLASATPTPHSLSTDLLFRTLSVRPSLLVQYRCWRMCNRSVC